MISMTRNNSERNPFYRNGIGFVLLAALMLMARTPVVLAEEAPTVTVRAKSWVKGEKVYLKDVADIDAPSQLTGALGQIYLAYAPGPKTEKKLHGGWICSKIRSKPWVPRNLRITVGEFVSVARTYQTVDDETYLKYFRDHVTERLTGSDMEFQIRRFKVIGNRPFPEGDLEIKLANAGGGDYTGSVSLSAIIYIDGSIERRVTLSGWVDRFEQVVCLLRPLPRHGVVSKEDLRLEKRNTTKLSGQFVKTFDRAVGKRLKHAVGAGDVLKMNGLEPVPVIERGDRVTIVAETGLLRVTALGIAQDQGAVGDQIRVKNCMGKKEIVAGIIDGSTVRIDF